jgi:hypothetical protein
VCLSDALNDIEPGVVEEKGEGKRSKINSYSNQLRHPGVLAEFL